MVEDVCPLPGAGQNRPLPLLLPPQVQIEDDLLNGEFAKALEACHNNLLVSVGAVFLGLNFLPQTLQTNTWPLCCPILFWLSVGKDLNPCNRHYRGEPSLSLVLCSLKMITSINNMNSLTNLPSTPPVPGASR